MNFGDCPSPLSYPPNPFSSLRLWRSFYRTNLIISLDLLITCWSPVQWLSVVLATRNNCFIYGTEILKFNMGGSISFLRVEAKGGEVQELSMAMFSPCAGTQLTVRKHIANPWGEAWMRDREQPAGGTRSPGSSCP